MLRRLLTPSASTGSLMLSRACLRESSILRSNLPSVAAVMARAMATSAAAAADTSSSSNKPFDKVLIANRGEIAGRVIKTCRKYGIQTVAIYSTADRQAPFVSMADESFCIGPPASSESYLQVDRVLEAIRATGAQAVHPGYGFLSENAGFAEAMQQQGVAWLGPPVSAIQDMGDKLRSKELAQAAGVTTIPGYEGTLDSIEHVFQVMQTNGITYPILIKAAAGGGGKGMRVCYTDQDVKEAFPMAKSEALKFFKDDRLLMEKYIENPHHIEFQVLAGPKKGQPGELDVLVFPERECSIQRRNQKIIEESPSCLLKAETRKAMAEQVKLLVRQVGYTSAGTMEFLVDEQQNFYFLEMNTRLQVEHPVTESITGFDLVKGMLWVGAGWGIPPEMLERVGNAEIVPHCGHAVEARIYAEDPLRGFLPSTGPLVPYAEPLHLDEPYPTSRKDNPYRRLLRVDSGVMQGSVVTPFYDPMLSKVIVQAGTRAEAVEGLAQAMDHYVIEGVQHNARLVNAVLRHEAFKQGQTPTSFLKRHFPDGFVGVQLKPAEKEELAAAVAAIAQIRRTQLQQPPLTGTSSSSSPSSSSPSDAVVVKLGGLFGPAYRVTLGDTSAKVQAIPSDEEGTPSVPPFERTVTFDKPIDYNAMSYLAHCTLDGKLRAIQVVDEKATGELKVQMYGADMMVLVQSIREYELSKHMHVPIIPDTSDMVLSPMPGALISFAVSPGDVVQEGQELCIVEAMKMQNIIRSPRAGEIATLRVKVGASVAADQILLDFVANEENK